VRRSTGSSQTERETYGNDEDRGQESAKGRYGLNFLILIFAFERRTLLRGMPLQEPLIPSGYINNFFSSLTTRCFPSIRAGLYKT
jgi:hypothetical protein